MVVALLPPLLDEEDVVMVMINEHACVVNECGEWSILLLWFESKMDFFILVQYRFLIIFGYFGTRVEAC